MDEKKQVSYYAIIPANVRYDKEISANAKLLYGEITALCNAKGYCWATNQYFANLYSVSKKTVSRWISELEDKGYINSYMQYKDGSREVEQRVVSINNTTDKKVDTLSPKMSIPLSPKMRRIILQVLILHLIIIHCLASKTAQTTLPKKSSTV